MSVLQVTGEKLRLEVGMRQDRNVVGLELRASVIQYLPSGCPGISRDTEDMKTQGNL
jgi:hypothetical protein